MIVRISAFPAFFCKKTSIHLVFSRIDNNLFVSFGLSLENTLADESFVKKIVKKVFKNVEIVLSPIGRAGSPCIKSR